MSSRSVSRPAACNSLANVQVTVSVLVTLMFETGEPSEQLDVMVHPGGTSSLTEYPEPAATLNVR